MLRFFEPDANNRWLAPTPPPAPEHSTSSAVPTESPAVAARRTSSLPVTVNLVKDRWHPSPFPLVAVSAAASLKNAAFSGCGGGGGLNGWQESGQATDLFLEKLQGGKRSSMAADTRGKSNQHDMMEDWRKRGSTVHEEESKKMADHKRQKINGDEKLYFLPSFDPSSSKMRATINQTVKEPVKNQKLGDKITTLQQLVSPFGKTDTASVLQEATVYIKALHEQINFQILSRRHLETNSSGNIQGNEGGGRSKLYDWGLCIIPTSSAVINFANQECPDHSIRELINQLN